MSPASRRADGDRRLAPHGARAGTAATGRRQQPRRQRHRCGGKTSAEDPSETARRGGRAADRRRARRAGTGQRVKGERDVARRLKALGRILLDAVPDDFFERRWQIRFELHELRRLFAQDRRHGLGGGVAPERSAAGQHFIEHGPEREEIRAGIDRLVPHLFRRHVTDRADDGAGIRDGGDRLGSARVRGKVARQAEVQHLHLSIGQQEDVLRLQIAVNEMFVVRGREAACDLKRDIDRLAGGNGAVDHPLTQRLPLEQLGDDEELVVVNTGVEDADDVRMRECRDRLGFVFEGARRSGSLANPSGRILTATSRFRRVSRAR